MRFGLVHRVMTNALAALGVLSLLASGELGRWVNIAIAVGLVAALSVPESWAKKPWLGRLVYAPVVLLIVECVRLFFFKQQFLELAVEFAAVVQLVRLATRNGAAHDQHVIVLALLHLVAGTVLGGGLAYAGCLLGFLIVAPAALVLSHLRREVEGNYKQGARDRTGLPVDVPRILRSRRVVGRTFLVVMCSLAVPILMFDGLLFLIFPRVGLQLMLLSPHRPRMVGYSEVVDLGATGVLREDPAIVMRISDLPNMASPPAERVPLYLRGTALDAFDGRSAWSRTVNERRAVPRENNLFVIDRSAEVDLARVMRVELEPADPPVLFTPPNAASMRVGLRSDSAFQAVHGVRVERGNEGDFRYRGGEDRGVRYEIYMARPGTAQVPSLGRDDRARYLALPPLSPRISALAADWTKDARNAQEKAQSIETHLRTEFRYDYGAPSSGTAAPLEHFLFESKRGHCEFYSTAMAVMLRTQGIPTRNVVGFSGGSYNRFGKFYAVRQSDAHTWVEAFIDGRGWVTFDPTPAADSTPKAPARKALHWARDLFEAMGQSWDRNVLRYSLERQVSLLERARSLFAIGGEGGEGSGWVGGLREVRWVAPVSLVGGAYLLYRRRKQRRTKGAEPSADQQRAATLATQLYEQLDGAMAAAGVGRAQGTPPLRHAESGVVKSHPCGREILSLTEIYLDSRFGGRVLNDEQRRDFERRVKAIKTYKAR